MTMNSTQFIENLATRLNVTKKDTETFIKAYQAEIGATLAANEKLTFVGYGTYEVKDRPERKGRNPQTGEEITIAASKIPTFKPSKSLKDKVNNKEAK